MTLDTITTATNNIVALFSYNIPVVLTILGALWGFNIVNWLIGSPLNVLGVYPRHLIGLFGIFFSPFLHANFNHLFFNTIPLFLLLNFILLSGIHALIIVTFYIAGISGALVWLFGRKAIHLGASGVIMGYWGYLLLKAYYAPSESTIILAVITIYYLGGLLFNLFPTEERVSWEGHLFGLIAGLATVFIVAF